MHVHHILPLFPEVVGIYTTSTDSNKVLKILENSKWNVRNSGLGLQGDSEAYGGDNFNFFSSLILDTIVDKKSSIKFSDICFEKQSCI